MNSGAETQRPESEVCVSEDLHLPISLQDIVSRLW